jgi:hypothetical protein
MILLNLFPKVGGSHFATFNLKSLKQGIDFLVFALENLHLGNDEGLSVAINEHGNHQFPSVNFQQVGDRYFFQIYIGDEADSIGDEGWFTPGVAWTRSVRGGAPTQSMGTIKNPEETNMSRINEPLKTILRKYCQVECYDPKLLREAINTCRGFPYDVELFKTQLREAIDLTLISPAEYEELTGEDFDSQEELQNWLEELWNEINSRCPLTVIKIIRPEGIQSHEYCRRHQ